ncbi:MAG: CvpA family protein [Candidatus Saganbacteria bacterium]|nr:CvpA family protein [Candidatus Saganbacteria bacterium]
MISWVDICAIIFLVIITYHGALRGIARTILDIIAVLLAIFASSQIYNLISVNALPILKTSGNLGYAITFAVVWIAVYLALDILLSAVQKFVKIQFLPVVERLGGGALGFVKGALITGIVIQLLLISPLPMVATGDIRGSMASKLTLPTLRETYSKAFALFPKIDFFIRERIIPSTPSAPTKVK